MKKIKFLVLWVGTKCTLKCKNCCNLIPYVKQVSYDIEKVIENIRYITSYCEIESLQIQGGEPFTHPRLGELIQVVAQCENISRITIASNASIKPSAECINILKETSPKVSVRYSEYECISKEWRERLIIELANEGINVRPYDFLFHNGEWFDSGDVNQQREKNQNQLKKIYNSCGNRDCWTVADDYMVNCGKIVNLMEIKQDSEWEANNAINITQLRSKGGNFIVALEQFEKKYENEIPDLCSYCKYQDIYIPAAIQLKNNLSII